MSINMKNTSPVPHDGGASVSATVVSRRKTLADQITSVLREKLRDGSYVPGMRLPSESAMTGRFQVSRTVIREAISRLKSEGLVGSRRGSGTVVLEPDRTTPFRLDIDVQDSVRAVLRVIELRRGVEGEMAALAAQRRTRAQNRKIGLALKNIDKAASAGKDGVQEDFAFHAAISEAAHNPLYTALLQFLSQFLQAAIRVARMNEARREDFSRQVCEEHAAIAQAIAEGDPDAARAAALLHMENSAHRIQSADLAFWTNDGGRAARRLADVEGLHQGKTARGGKGKARQARQAGKARSDRT